MANSIRIMYSLGVAPELIAKSYHITVAEVMNLLC